MARVLLAIPSREDVKARFMCATIAMFATCAAELDMQVYNFNGTYLGPSRTMLAQAAIEKQCTHIMFLDSDMTFDPEIVRRLVKCQQYIVGGTYRLRKPPYEIIGKNLDDSGISREQLTDGATTPFRVKRLPTGLLLIHTKVFERIADGPLFYTTGKGPDTFVGEDYDFCDRCVAAGIRIWCDPVTSRLAKHIGEIEVGI